MSVLATDTDSVRIPHAQPVSRPSLVNSWVTLTGRRLALSAHTPREVLAPLATPILFALVIAPALEGRHPDHRVAAQLVRDGCFVAGLAKIAPELPKHRPLKILHCLAYRQDYVKPSFVVDVSDEFEQKLEAIRCFQSQFEGLTQAGEVYPNGEPLEDVVRHYGAYYGTLIRRPYGEPFLTTEMVRVDDVMALEVSTF